MANNNRGRGSNNPGGGGMGGFGGGMAGALFNTTSVIKSIVAVGDAFANFSKSAISMSVLFAKLAPDGENASKMLEELVSTFAKLTGAASVFRPSLAKLAQRLTAPAGAAPAGVAAPAPKTERLQRMTGLPSPAPAAPAPAPGGGAGIAARGGARPAGVIARVGMNLIGATARGGAAAASAVAGASSSAAVAGAAMKVAAAFGAVSTGVAAVAAPVALAVAAFAGIVVGAMAVAGAFYSMVMAAAQYVQASNPVAVMALNLVLRDLTAVIGTALLPVVQLGTKVIRDFADTMLPVARRVAEVMGALAKVIEPVAMMFNLVVGKIANTLVTYFQFLVDVLAAFAPAITSAMGTFGVMIDVFNQVSQLIASILVPIFRVLGVSASLVMSVFKAVATIVYAVISVIVSLFQAVVNVIMSVLEPVILVFEFVAEIIEIVADTFATLMEGVIAVAGAFAAFFDFKAAFAPLKEYLSSLAFAFKKLATYMLLFIAGIAKMLGFTSAYKAITDKLKGGAKESSSGLAAAVNPTIKSAESLGQDVMQSAFVNTSVMPGEDKEKTKEEAFMDEIRAFIGMMDKGGLTAIIAAGIKAGAGSTVKAVGAKLAYPFKWLGSKVGLNAAPA